ncbi:polysaccharide pyruvyl transferase family protein [Falsigemmobacter faecalis]|uniref:Polysaccharide pyruvyl transferase family protein n=1 Tax=Falsigemmobacter faecalis TaxID=2488730 RepID=A0A3P3D1L5_9RHOB|nr:polysaccharide pyruvyl transferase family protein [Falsigemmobacter faecalis]RRH68303.1 polysaccharide pyruvyl transferase family protein [Falsigemmobacter faecalis]
MSRKIALHASYFSDNFGDVLLWEIARDMIFNSSSEVSVTDVNMPNNLRDTYTADSKELKGVDTVIFGGGGYFCPPSGSPLKWRMRNYIRHRAALDLANRVKSCVFLGVGFGDLQGTLLGSKIKSIPSDKVKLCALRDEESVKYYNSLTGKSSGVICDDLVLGWLTTQGGRYSPDGYFGIHTDFKNMSDQRVSNIISYAKEIKNSYGRIRIIVDCPSKSGKLSAQKVSNELGGKVDILTFNGNTKDFLNGISECSAIFTTKLHVGICAASMSIPVVSYPTHTKTPRFYRSVGMENSIMDDQSIDKILSIVSEPNKFIMSNDVSSRIKNNFKELSASLTEAIG